jgi:hypothetical protein
LRKQWIAINALSQILNVGGAHCAAFEVLLPIIHTVNDLRDFLFCLIDANDLPPVYRTSVVSEKSIMMENDGYEKEPIYRRANDQFY